MKFIDLALSKCNFERKTLFLAKDKMIVIVLSSSICLKVNIQGLFLKGVKGGFKGLLKRKTCHWNSILKS